MNNYLVTPFMSDSSGHWLSLSKLVDKKIVDIVGYISTYGSGASFKLSKIIFEDGTFVFIEGEHDYPYVSTVRSMPMSYLDDGKFMEDAYNNGEDSK